MATILLQAAGAALGGVFGPLGAVIGRAAGALGGAALDRSVLNGLTTVTGARLGDARLPDPDHAARSGDVSAGQPFPPAPIPPGPIPPAPYTSGPAVMTRRAAPPPLFGDRWTGPAAPPSETVLAAVAAAGLAFAVAVPTGSTGVGWLSAVAVVLATAFAVQWHASDLDRAHPLRPVTATDVGRERHYELSPAALAPVTALVGRLTGAPAGRLTTNALDALDTEVRRASRDRRTSRPAPTTREETA